MAVSKGKIQPVILKSSSARVCYRTSLSGGPVAFYELPSPKPPLRTVMVRADAAVRVSRTFGWDYREPLRVIRLVDRKADTQRVVFNALLKDADIAVRTRQGQTTLCDTAVKVTHSVQCRGDTAQRIGRLLGASADLKQTIFIVLINESHVIAT
ncbi:hypothetical protein KQH29_00095 [bacterium]|nr:hypothetical protein [bacterium]